MRIHAVITARNAAPTLGALLSHLAAQGVTVTLVDHGSTDATWEIAGQVDREVLTARLQTPFDGVFDLTRQLDLKADLLESSDADWLMHLDADEFLLPPDNDLRSWLAAQEHPVIAATEFMFLPISETEAHRPETFRETMTRYVPFAPHNPKQRIFRRGTPLDLWRRTGGHSITRDAADIAPERLPMAHYIGLSLDHIRAQYAPRIFAARDLAKGWHDTRVASSRAVTAPTSWRDITQHGWDHSEPATSSPFFAPQEPEHLPPLPAEARHFIAAHPTLEIDDLAAALGAERVSAGFDRLISDPRPVLTVLSDGQAVVAGAENVSRATEEWCRHIASLRQLSLLRGTMAEMRAEDLTTDAAWSALAAAPGSARHHLPRYPARAVPARLSPEAQDRFTTIAGDLMIQLGYEITS